MFNVLTLKNGKVVTSKFVGTGPSSYKKRIYRAAVLQRLRNIVLLDTWRLFLRAKYRLQNISDLLRSSCYCFDHCEHGADRAQHAATIRAVFLSELGDPVLASQERSRCTVLAGTVWVASQHQICVCRKHRRGHRVESWNCVYCIEYTFPFL
jgi:hypothetical protein